MAANSVHGADALSDVDRERAHQAVEMLKSLRQNTTLQGLSWRALRDAGMPPVDTDEVK